MSRSEKSMRSQLAVVSSSSAFQALASAASALVATRVVGAHERGLMVMGLVIGGVFGVVGGLGTGTALRSRLPSCTDAGGRRRLASAYTWCSIGGGILAVIAAVSATALSSSAIDSALATLPFLVAVAAFTAAQLILTQTVEAWYADGRFRRGGFAAARMAAGGLLGVLAGLSVTRSAAWILLAQAIGMILVGAREARSLLRAELLTPIVPLASEVRTLLRAGFPTLGLTVGLAIALRADRYLIGAFAGAAAVGVYALAATLAEVPRMLPLALGQLHLRAVSLGKGAAGLTTAVLRAVGAATVVGLFVATSGWLLIAPVFGDEFRGAVPLLVVLLVAEVFVAPHLVASLGLLGGGWARTAGTVGLCGGAASVLLYAVGVSWGGAMGLALFTVLIYAGLSFVSWTLLMRRIGNVEERNLECSR